MRFPPDLRTRNRPDILVTCDLVVIAVPAALMRSNLERVQPFIRPGVPVVCATKGIEPESGKLMPEVMADGGLRPEQVCVVSGPNFSVEIAAGLPAATVVAAERRDVAAAAQAAFSSERFRVYTSDDVTGVAFGGALKNVVAIACGISDGLGYGQNAKAALMTRGLAEITRLGLACGARATTFLGLAGIGDMIATCESDLSRNRRLGLGDRRRPLARRSHSRGRRCCGGGGDDARGADAGIGARGRDADRVGAAGGAVRGKPPRESMMDLMRRATKAEFG